MAGHAFGPSGLLDDQALELISLYSLDPLISEHQPATMLSQRSSTSRPEGRLLSLELDGYLIRRIVETGHATQHVDRSQSSFWHFVLDGVTVVTRTDARSSDKDLSATFVTGFLAKEVQQSAKESYDAMLQSLEDAIDPEGRLSALQHKLNGGRIFHGLDLVQLPSDCPLLQCCAQNGWDECVDWLLQSGFCEGLGHQGKHRMTILHLVAWGGHENVFNKLEPWAHNLVDIANEYGELPEMSGFIRGRQLGGISEQAQACLRLAERCRRLRTGDHSVTIDSFHDDANLQMESAKKQAEVLLPYGVQPDVVQRHMRGRLQCTDFVARHVEIESVLSFVLKSMAHNRNLERLVLNYCGLSLSAASLLSSFLDEHGQGVPILELSGNPFGNDGIKRLLCPGIRMVQSLDLSDTGMTGEGLGILCHHLKGCSLEKLNLGANDFEVNACDGMKSLAQFLRTSQHLKSLNLSKTRLQQEELRLLAEAVRTAPALETLSLVQVGFKGDFLSETPVRNPLLAALEDPRCGVTRVEVSILEYPSLWKRLFAAKRNRSKGFGRGKGEGSGGRSGVGKGGYRSQQYKGASHKPSRYESETHASASCEHESLYILSFPRSLRVRMKGWHQTSPTRPPQATLCTERFSFAASAGELLSCVNVGCVFDVEISIDESVDNLVSLGVVPSFKSKFLAVKQASPAEEIFTAFHSIGVVVLRPDTQEVMLVQEPTTVASQLRIRIMEFILADDFVLQDRFGYSHSRKKFSKLDVDEVLQGLSLEDFSDAEVHMLAHLERTENYLTLVGSPVMTTRHNVLMARMLRDCTIQRLMCTFADELKRRNVSGTSGNRLPSQDILASRVTGKDNQRRVDLQANLVQCVLKHFTNSIEVKVIDLNGLECFDPERKWKKLLFLAHVSKDMLEEGEVGGVRPTDQSPKWVRTQDVANHLEDRENFHLADAIGLLIKDKPHLQLHWRECGQVPLKILRVGS